MKERIFWHKMRDAITQETAIGARTGNGLISGFMLLFHLKLNLPFVPTFGEYKEPPTLRPKESD